MWNRLSKYSLILGLIWTISTLILPGVCRADSAVERGWDLFHTEDGTAFAGVPLVGVPTGSFNFIHSNLGRIRWQSDSSGRLLCHLWVARRVLLIFPHSPEVGNTPRGGVL